MIRFLGVLFLVVSVGLFGFGCKPVFVTQQRQEQAVSVQPMGTKLSVEQVFQIFSYNFPHLRNGQTLFVTTGEYLTYPVEVFASFFSQQLGNLPPCVFKASLVTLGMLHQHLHPLVSAGIAMGGPDAPPWFVIIMDNLGRIWGFDSIMRRVWKVLPTDVNLILF